MLDKTAMEILAQQQAARIDADRKWGQAAQGLVIGADYGHPVPAPMDNAKTPWDHKASNEANKACGCIGGGLLVGRVHPAILPDASELYYNGRLGADMSRQPCAEQLVSVGMGGDFTMPAGEAFTRETCRVMLAQAVRAAVNKDRCHLAHDGWVTRGNAARLFADLLSEVLEDAHAPHDAAAEILAQMDVRLAVWAKG